MKSLSSYIKESSDEPAYGVGDKMKLIAGSKKGKIVYIQQVQPKGPKMKQHSYMVSLDKAGKQDQWSVGETDLAFAD